MTFNFGQGAAGGGQGFNFGTPATTSGTGFSFGSTPSSSSGAGIFGQSGLAFGMAPQATSAGGFSFGMSTPASSVTSGSSGLSFGAVRQTAPSTGGFSLGTQQPGGGFNFGTAASTSSFSTPSVSGSGGLFQAKAPASTVSGAFSILGLSTSAPKSDASTAAQASTGGFAFGALTPLQSTNKSSIVSGGTGSSGTTLGGATLPGSTAGGMSFGGASLGNTLSGAATLSSATFGGGISGGTALGGTSSGGATLGNATFGGGTSGGIAVGAVPFGGSSSGGTTLSATTLGTTTFGSGLTGGTAFGNASLSGTPSGSSVLGTSASGGGTSSGTALSAAPSSGGFSFASGASQGFTGFAFGKTVQPATTTVPIPSMANQLSKAPPVASIGTSLPSFGAVPFTAGSMKPADSSQASAPSGTQFLQFNKPSIAATITTQAVKPSISTGAPLLKSAISFGAPASASTVVATTGPTLTSNVATSSGFAPIATMKVTAAPTTTVAKTSATLAAFPPSAVSSASSAQTLAATVASAKPVATVGDSSKAQPAQSDTSQTQASTIGKLTYKQLEDTVNKWVQELEEQERTFLNQANQVNAWDRLLIEDGEKISEVNDQVERVKADQKRLDRELDFILSQQQELEDTLIPLEEHIRNQEGVQYMQHADVERERTYKLAENIDAELKRMTEDLREIIEHVNASNISHKESDDPMAQIVKILNAHMDSLQWVDQNSALLGRRVEEVGRLLESRRRDHERSMKLSFD